MTKRKIIIVLTFFILTSINAQNGSITVYLKDSNVVKIPLEQIDKISFSKKGKIERIVILGSSTAAGKGPSSIDSSWVNRFRRYAEKVNLLNKVINLAVSGYTTYHIMPDGFVPTKKNRPLPSKGHNITKALELNPTSIIINLPSNDAFFKYSVDEQIANYKVILKKAKEQNVPVWITTTQPRNNNSDSTMTKELITMRDSTYSLCGNHTIDFWTTLATEKGKINPKYDSGDGIHLNDAGHKILFERVVVKGIIQ